MSLVERVKAWPMPASDVWVRYSEHGPDGAFSAAVLRTAREAVAAEADREIAQRDATIERLCDALVAAADAMETLTRSDICEASHHAKADKHGWSEPCPCAARFVAAYESACAALSEARKT